MTPKHFGPRRALWRRFAIVEHRNGQWRLHDGTAVDPRPGDLDFAAVSGTRVDFPFGRNPNAERALSEALREARAGVLHPHGLWPPRVGVGVPTIKSVHDPVFIAKNDWPTRVTHNGAVLRGRRT